MPASVPPVADEREALLAYLAHQRHLVRVAAHGLSNEQARTTPSASSLSVGGILKHLAQVERSWMGTVRGEPLPVMADAMARYVDGLVMREDETLQAILDDYAASAAHTEAVIAGIANLGQPVPVPRDAPWFPKDVDAWSVRWVLLHLIEETARHLGHADIVRESLDGATAIPLLAAAEQWEETAWVKPWRPAAGPVAAT